MAVNKQITSNTAAPWRATGRYRVNKLVSYNGNTYQNTTGKNSVPDLLTDWVLTSPLVLINELDNAVVHKTGDETISGNKTFDSGATNSVKVITNDQYGYFDAEFTAVETGDTFYGDVFADAFDPSIVGSKTSGGVVDFGIVKVKNGQVQIEQKKDALFTRLIFDTPLMGSIVKIPSKSGTVAVEVGVYKAKIDQTGTNNPVPTIFKNTLGATINWTRTATGLYEGFASGKFPVNTQILVTSEDPTIHVTATRIDNDIVSVTSSTIPGNAGTDDITFQISIETF